MGLGFFAHACRTMWTIAGRTRLATAGFLAGIAGGRRVKPWAPVLVLAEVVLPLLDKNFIPLGAALLLVAFASLLRRGAVPRSTSDPVAPLIGG
ncbi:hypothetical protein ACFVYA_06020 [Amycolatopsis sp. NPDC058278]|uniref:hypothetical protein n=1 Tax=Amycolatopsis sp. NPDC058278 TaxID=3346417 RepID=UPI0036D95C9A